MALYCVVAKIGKNMLRPASSPVARDHFWGIFELIIQESGDEESDGKGRKKNNSRLGRRSTLISITPLSRFSLASSSLVFLGKPVEEAVLIRKIIFINGTSEPYTDLLSMISFSDQFFLN